LLQIPTLLSDNSPIVLRISSCTGLNGLALGESLDFDVVVLVLGVHLAFGEGLIKLYF